ncbi:MAG: ROK family protein [Sphingomonas sp.]
MVELNDQPLVAGIELGGTKCIVVLARGERISRRETIVTETPDRTLAKAVRTLRGWYQAERFAAIGIASFGPLDLNPRSMTHGQIVKTTKPGWSGADVLGAFSGSFDVPVGIDTDVGGAALAEGRWGAATGCTVHGYLTIGTGIGLGLVVNGSVIHGLQHPEAGHVRIRRAPGDRFVGICPFHGDCVEGLCSGPAIAARAGASAPLLLPDDPIWDRVANDLAEFLTGVLLTMSPQRILIGGGVAQGQPDLLIKIRSGIADRLAGYLHGVDAHTLEQIITPPALGADAGPLGAVALAPRTISS